jgi:hypothetical protein
MNGLLDTSLALLLPAGAADGKTGAGVVDAEVLKGNTGFLSAATVGGVAGAAPKENRLAGGGAAGVVPKGKVGAGDAGVLGSGVNAVKTNADFGCSGVVVAEFSWNREATGEEPPKRVEGITVAGAGSFAGSL